MKTPQVLACISLVLVVAHLTNVSFGGLPLLALAVLLLCVALLV